MASDDQNQNDDQDKNKDEQSEDQNQNSADTVSLETHRKLLDEKKKMQKKLEEVETAQKARAEKELREKEQYKELLETREKEFEELKSKLTASESEKQDIKKMGSFLKSVNAEIPEQYWGLIDLDSIVVDDNGSIDQITLKKAVKDFQTKFPEIVKPKKKPNMPNEAANGGSGKLTYDEWMALEYKDQLKRQKDVVLD